MDNILLDETKTVIKIVGMKFIAHFNSYFLV